MHVIGVTELARDFHAVNRSFVSLMALTISTLMKNVDDIFDNTNFRPIRMFNLLALTVMVLIAVVTSDRRRTPEVFTTLLIRRRYEIW